MSVFFEYKIDIDSIKKFLMYIFDVKESELQLFELNYFYDEVENYVVYESTQCLCLYLDSKGDVCRRLEFFIVNDQSPEFMIKKVSNFLKDNTWNGFVVVENTDDDYLKMSNQQLPQSVYLDDEFFDDDVVYHLRNKKPW